MKVRSTDLYGQIFKSVRRSLMTHAALNPPQRPYGQIFRSIRHSPARDAPNPPQHPYGQIFKSVRHPPARDAAPNPPQHPYGQIFKSVRELPITHAAPRSAQRPVSDDIESVTDYEGPPAHAPLLPKGVIRPRRPSPRLRAFDYTGHYAYMITVNTHRSAPYFRDRALAAKCVRVLLEQAEKRSFEALAYCLMPDHLHLLARGLKSDSRLVPFMQDFNRITSFHFKQDQGKELWRSYYDHVVRREQKLGDIAAYIWNNPVEAGLSPDWGGYEFSGPAGRLADRFENLSLRHPSPTLFREFDASHLRTHL